MFKLITIIWFLISVSMLAFLMFNSTFEVNYIVLFGFASLLLFISSVITVIVSIVAWLVIYFINWLT